MRKADGSTGRIKALKHTCTHTHTRGYTTSCIFNILPAALSAWFRCTVVNPETSHRVVDSKVQRWQSNWHYESFSVVNFSFVLPSTRVKRLRGLWSVFRLTSFCRLLSASIKKERLQVISEALTTCSVGSGGEKGISSHVLSSIIEA